MKKVFGDVDSFVVERQSWLRGTRNGNATLLNKDGQKCCLGFYAIACGLPPEVIFERPEPMDVVYMEDREDDISWDTKLVSVHANTCGSLMIANDSAMLTDQRREQKIIELFQSIGIDVSFK